MADVVLRDHNNIRVVHPRIPVFINDWSSEKGMLQDFGIEGVGPYRVLFASYTYENYEGSAFVLLYGDDGELYEVHGSHCSCHGLAEVSYYGDGTAETQWNPEITTAESLEHRVKNGALGNTDSIEPYEDIILGFVELYRAGKL